MADQETAREDRTERRRIRRDDAVRSYAGRSDAGRGPAGRNGDDERPDDRDDHGQNPLHRRFVSILLAEIERERYPSKEILDLLESCMSGRDRERIAKVLLDNLAAQRYPSPAMLRRIAHLVG